VKGITVRSCVLWCGQMRIFLLGHESAADAMEDITVTDCDIIHYAVNPPFLLEPGENMVLRNVTFQDIRVDGDGQRDFITLHPTVNQYMRVKEPGSIRNVLFKDITLSMPGKGLAYVIVEGADDKHTVQDVTFQNVVRCGKLLAPGQPGVAVGPYTSGIRFLGPGGAKTQPATRGGKAPGSRPSKATTSSQPQSGAPPADKALTLTLAGGVTMEFVLIPSGTFAMGSPPDEAGRNDDECPQRQVAIPKPFYMGIHEVTQEQYAAVMGTDPSNFKGATRPAERVTWEDTVEFCSRLSGSTGKAIRLPTEAEWEYACRAGSKARFCYGDDVDYSGLGQYAWYGANSAGQTHPVGQKQHNAWGLYDMHGNVWEWCGDIYTDPRPGAKNHYPREPVCRTRRVLRGGCWIDGPMNCRSATRSWILAGHGDLSIGFRVVADLG
jgi:formylglycine-generating enzyme required for sulfatase activity